jgi:hypothetical protein
MSFVSIAEVSVSLNMPVGILRDMCERGLIDGAVRFGRIWAVPENLYSSELSAICRD